MYCNTTIYYQVLGNNWIQAYRCTIHNIVPCHTPYTMHLCRYKLLYENFALLHFTQMVFLILTFPKSHFPIYSILVIPEQQ